MYATDNFLDRIYQCTLNPHNILNTPAGSLDTLIEEKRKKLRDILKLDLLDSWQFKPTLTESGCEQKNGYTLESGNAELLPELIIPYFVLRPQNPKGVVIYCPGHSNPIHGIFEDGAEKKFHKAVPITMALNDFIVYMIDFIGFGDVMIHNFNKDNPDKDRKCYANTANLLLSGVPLVGVRVAQTMALIDYVTANENMGKPILVGISGGGTVTMYAAALTDKIKAACISCYCNTFKGSIMKMSHCIDNYIPGILEVGEEPEITALAYPTPLLLTCGDKDPIYPVYSAQEAIDYVKKAYEILGDSNLITSEIFDGVHEISEEGIIPWVNLFGTQKGD